MNRKWILRTILMALTAILVVITSEDIILGGYDCTSLDLCCTFPGGIYSGVWVRVDTGGGPWSWDCLYIDPMFPWEYTCTGSDQNCVGRSLNYYYSKPECLSAVNPHSHGCCGTCSTPPCNDCTPDPPPSCPVGTTETNTGDFHSSTSTCCSRGTGCGEDCNTRDCYCPLCRPLCSDSGYSDTDLGQGEVPDDLNPSCLNGNSSTPNRETLCSRTYANCFCYSCLKQCPLPLSNTGDAKLILNDFRECTNDCSVKPPEDQDDCYEVESPQPTESLSITVNPPDHTNHYGFFSNTHTGDRLSDVSKLGTLNDPFEPHLTMTASYTDSNGANDIEGLFVWFRGSQYTGELGTPLYISNSAAPKASAKDSWGFMLRRNGSGWRPYVPSYNGSNVFWTSKDINNNDKVFSIKGTNGEQMVEVTITSGPIEDGNTVSIDFSLRFSDSNGDLFPGNVSEGLYKIYLMGLDKFSFTPYDNYGINYENYWSEGFKYHGYENLSPFWQENQLRYKAEQNQKYARDWTDTGKTWTIDRTGPQIETFAFGLPQENKLEVHWSVSDDKSLYSIVGNIYVSDELSAKQIELSADNSNISLHVPNPFFPKKTNEEDVGKLDGDWSFKVGPNMSSSTDKDVLYIDVGDNTAGLFEIYLTVFDDAGNVANSVISINIADWIATAGGVAYSAGGSYFSTKNLTSFDAKNPDLPYPASNPGLSLDKADISSELWGENLDENPQALVKSLIAKSYNITRYTGYKLANGYYDTLKKEFNMNKQNVIDLELEQVFPKSPDLAGSLSMICNKKTYCMFDYVGDLNIKNDVICDNKSVLFVAKNLIIDAPIKNTSDNKLSNKNGCIFVVQGDVLIKKGEDMSGSKLGYDIIHGYILADGIITIEDERPNNVTLDVMYKDIVDGIYINGGLSSSYKEDISIKINRHLRIEEKLTYPVLVIDYHPKYGVIAEIFFGRKNSIKSVEVGVKP